MSLPELSLLQMLPSPYELWEMQDGTIRDLVVVGYQFGKTTIKPTTQTARKEVWCLRVFVEQKRKPSYPFWWDLTQTTLIPQLLPYLEAAAGRPIGDPYTDLQALRSGPPVMFKVPVTFRISRVGSGPRARFPVVVNPSTPL